MSACPIGGTFSGEVLKEPLRGGILIDPSLRYTQGKLLRSGWRRWECRILRPCSGQVSNKEYRIMKLRLPRRPLCGLLAMTEGRLDSRFRGNDNGGMGPRETRDSSPTLTLSGGSGWISSERSGFLKNGI